MKSKAREVALEDLPPPPGAPAPAPALPSAAPMNLPAPPSPLRARLESLGAGAEDILSGPAVALTRGLPTPVVNAGNALNNWLARKTGMFPVIPQGGLPQLQAQREAQLQADRQAAGLHGVDWSRLAGQTLPWVAAPELKGLGMLGRILYGGGTGAIQGLEQPADSGWGQAKNALIGAGVGVALPGVAAGARRMIRGVQDPAVRYLAQHGITMTPGQLFGGAMRAAEEKASSIPLVGDLIKNAERRGVLQYNRATIDDALKPAGMKVAPGVPEGREMVEDASKQLSTAYDKLLPKLRGELDPQFVKELAAIRKLGQTLPEDRAKQLDAFLKNDILDRFNPKTGVALGETLKDIESKLGSEGRAYYRSPDPDQRKLGAALVEAQSALRRMVERSNPQYKGKLQQLNAAYARLLRVEGAASGRGAKEGIFTPSQMMSSVRRLDPSRNKRAFGHGKALGQGLAERAEKVLAKTVPDSGTTGRAFLGALLLGGPGVVSPVLGLGAAAAPFYTPWGQRALQTLAVHSGGPVRNAVSTMIQHLERPALAGAVTPALLAARGKQ